MGLLNRGDNEKEDNKNRKKRHSKVHAEVIINTDAETLHGKIKENVEPGSNLYTDELKSYNGLEDYVHEAVNHAERYVEGNVHTNGLENFWTLLKRCIKGTYIAIEPDHLHRYVAEEVFRFNTREESDGDRFMETVLNSKNKRLTYKKLIGAT
jgi:transposase-like protein